MVKEEWVKGNGNFLVATEDLLEWLIDDTQSARPVFETPNLTAGKRLKACLELRDFSEEERLLLI